MIVKRLRRGQSIDQAETVFTGQPTDVSVSGYTLRDADGVVRATLINRGVNFYEGETWRLNADGSTTRLELPAKSSINALVQGQLVVTTNQDWTAPSGQTFQSGDVLAWDMDAWLADPKTPARLVIHPGERESIEAVSATRNRLVVALFENVRGAVYVYDPADWSRVRLDLPQNVTVGVGSASERDDQVFVSVAGYLNPSSLWLADAATGAVDQVKALPPKFDADGLTVDQFEARSTDGTLIPYFVVHRADMPMDGSNPTLLYGYGGFQNSLLPGYSATVGKLWLERGGVYVIANTRGGGEFGPRWHDAALQQNRQRAHEDFQAVALDLIARDITSQPKLGIMGGSQGGLFMGAMLTQRPDLINAAVIQVPLFDMFRFNKLLAGASWQAEYGNPDIPEERAWIGQYSPYQNLRAGQPYPEVFIHTSTKDDRVHPGHARKAAARLEELGYPVLFYENTDGGHAAGANLRETARRIALEYTYLTRRLMDEPAEE
jgi:prolyl oligopeptidase